MYPSTQRCIAKYGGGYTQRGVAKGLKVHCLFMITEVSIRCQKTPEVGIRRIPAYTPQYTTASTAIFARYFYVVYNNTIFVKGGQHRWPTAPHSQPATVQQLVHNMYVICYSALTLLVGRQKGHPAVKN